MRDSPWCGANATGCSTCRKRHPQPTHGGIRGEEDYTGIFLYFLVNWISNVYSPIGSQNAHIIFKVGYVYFFPLPWNSTLAPPFWGSKPKKRYPSLKIAITVGARVCLSDRPIFLRLKNSVSKLSTTHTPTHLVLYNSHYAMELHTHTVTHFNKSDVCTRSTLSVIKLTWLTYSMSLVQFNTLKILGGTLGNF